MGKLWKIFSNSQVEYFDWLAKMCQMNIVPKVFHTIFLDLLKMFVQYPNSFREFNYTILDDDTFERKHFTEW